MALLEQTHIQGDGMVKEIEGSAISLVLQNLQQDQYQYPIKSFIREIASNSVDAIEEKKIARSILTGKSKVEDHYSSLESDITKDSKFDPEYYDLNYLSDEDTIIIKYVNVDRSVSNRDKIIIEDTGVGLGGNRLRGFFRPAFSTKRLNKSALGKWGIGSKSGLATGVESYQIVSRHNGREYKFDIYNDRFYSTTPRFSESGENPCEVWKAKRYTEDGGTEDFDNLIYYTLTDKPNGLTVIMDVKNPIRNKNKFFDAVKSQLTYFNYVRFIEQYSSGVENEIFFKTKVLYQDEHLIIPEENYYSVPHLVLNGVNYGVIDFSEAEMDEKRGNIGIIGDPSEIDVNQSRESVRYTDRTRKALKKYLENSILVAQNYVNKNMLEFQEDFLKWAIACRDLKSKNTRDNVFSRLSGLADLEQVEFTYKDTPIKYNQTNFKKIFVGFRVSRVEVVKSNNAYTTKSIDINSWENFSPNVIFYRDSSDNRYTSLLMGYISELTHERYIYLITPTDVSELTEEESNMHELVLSLLKDSKTLSNLSEIVIPQEFIDAKAEAQKQHEEAVKEEMLQASLSEKELRKKNGLLLYHTFALSRNHYRGDITSDSYISKTRCEVHIDNIPTNFTKETTIYGTTQDIPYLKSVLFMMDKTLYERGNLIESSRFKVITVSKEVVKYIDQHATHVIKALQDIKGTKLSVMKSIKEYNTASYFKYLHENKDFRFLGAFKDVDEDAFNVFKELCSYAKLNGFGGGTKVNLNGSEELKDYLTKISDFQLQIIKYSDDKDKIAEISKSLFNTPKIDSCDAVDIEIYAKFKALEDYVSDLKDMFRSLSDHGDYNIPGFSEYSSTYREYIKLKGVPSYSEFLKDWNEELKVEEYKNNN